MVHVFYTKLNKKLSPETQQKIFDQLPERIQTKIQGFVHWQDAQRSLLGYYLLAEALTFLNVDHVTLKNLKFNEYGKPYLIGCPDFNISHAGDFIVCAISQVSKVGVDIEEVKNINLKDFEDQFTDLEWQHIMESDNSLHQFFTCWTKKEALVKATGLGLYDDLSSICTVSKEFIWEEENWYWLHVPIYQNYVLHVACNNFPINWQLRAVSLDAIS